MPRTGLGPAGAGEGGGAWAASQGAPGAPQGGESALDRRKSLVTSQDGERSGGQEGGGHGPGEGREEGEGGEEGGVPCGEVGTDALGQGSASGNRGRDALQQQQQRQEQQPQSQQQPQQQGKDELLDSLMRTDWGGKPLYSTLDVPGPSVQPGVLPSHSKQRSRDGPGLGSGEAGVVTAPVPAMAMAQGAGLMAASMTDAVVSGSCHFSLRDVGIAGGPMPLFEGSSGDDEDEGGREMGHEVSGRGKKGSGTGSGSGSDMGPGSNGGVHKEMAFGESWLMNHNALDAVLGPSTNTTSTQLARYVAGNPSSPPCTVVLHRQNEAHFMVLAGVLLVLPRLRKVWLFVAVTEEQQYDFELLAYAPILCCADSMITQAYVLILCCADSMVTCTSNNNSSNWAGRGRRVHRAQAWVF